METKIVLMSIKPKYVEKILGGEKLVEYRKKAPIDADFLFIYSSSPVKKVVAKCRIIEVLEDTPEEIWRQTGEVGGIDKESYDQYFSGHSTAFALRLGDIDILPQPVELKDLGISTPPQSYMYLKSKNKRED